MEEENLRGKEKSNFLKVFKKKEIWISLVAGLVLGGVLIYILISTNIVKVAKVEKVSIIKEKNETVLKVNNDKITSNEVYQEMKKYYPISYLLELVDDKILEDKYNLTEEQQAEIDEQANYYLNMYKTYYGYTEEEFLSENGFESKEKFKEYLTLDYKRNLYYIDYLKTIISEEEINNYYNEKVYGEIDTKHILVAVSDDVTDEQALKLAKEIIAKLDAGTSFDDVVKEYEGKITYEELGYNGFDSNLVSEYVEASKTLENGTYSKEPVKTEFGYHIIYKIDQKEKPTLEEATNDIVTILGKDLETEDSNLRYKALIKLREENNLDIKDSKFKTEYEKYCKEINGEEE